MPDVIFSKAQEDAQNNAKKEYWFSTGLCYTIPLDRVEGLAKVGDFEYDAEIITQIDSDEKLSMAKDVISALADPIKAPILFGIPWAFRTAERLLSMS